MLFRSKKTENEELREMTRIHRPVINLGSETTLSVRNKGRRELRKRGVLLRVTEESALSLRLDIRAPGPGSGRAIGVSTGSGKSPLGFNAE
jgi:hypothetical protein